MTTPMLPRRTSAHVGAVAAAVGLAVAALSGAPQPAAAQSGSQPQATAPATDVSEREVQQMAQISTELLQLNESLRGRMAEAATDAERASIREDAQAEAVQTIQDNGLSVDRYNAIVAAARQDDALMQRIRRTIQGL